MSIKKRVFGMMPDDREVELYRLENRSGADEVFTGRTVYEFGVI